MIAWPKTPKPADWCGFTGTPYVERGRGKTGVDCWGLNCWIYADLFGVNVPDHGPAFDAALDHLDPTDLDRCERAFMRTAQRLIRTQKKTWTELARPAEGATVLIRRAGYPVHTGIYLRGGDILHADFEIGSVIRERLSDLKDVIEGYYIPPGIDVDPGLIKPLIRDGAGA